MLRLKRLLKLLRLPNPWKLKKVSIEGGAMFTILALQGMEDPDDWRARAKIKVGKQILATKLN